MSLSFKLYAALFAVMVVGLGIFAVVNLSSQRESQLRMLREHAEQTTMLVNSSIHYSMLINRKGDIDQMFRHFAEMPEIDLIRIYDKQGHVIFSTRMADSQALVLRTDEPCRVCHVGQPALREIPTNQRIQTSLGSAGGVLLTLAPIRNEAGCAGSGCHPSLDSQAVLGVLDVRMSMAGLNLSIENNQRNTIAASAILISSVLLVTGALIWKFIRVPVDRLTRATRAIASGDLSCSIPVVRRDEIGQLAASFNVMVHEVSRAQCEVTEWSHTLEERISRKSEELERLHGTLVQSEKMASLGRLAATVAHELNNPLGGILAYTCLIQKRISGGPLDQPATEATLRDLSMIRSETTRCGNIVNDLLHFSRKGAGVLEPLDLRIIVMACANLTSHHLGLSGIVSSIDLPDQPVRIPCMREQLQQALLAVMMNSIEAMPDGGRLAVSLIQCGEMVGIRVCDTGCGIKADLLPHIFEPFVSDKPGGKGLGLGLSVAYGIMEQHGGRIDVESTPGKGTIMTLFIPREPQQYQTRSRPDLVQKGIGHG